MLYRPWRNHEGQMTLFQQILRNPDVFNFGDHHHHAVAMEVSFLKLFFWNHFFKNEKNNIYFLNFQVFLGGLPSTITETDLRSFFSNYGEVCEVVIMYDQEKKKSRGFGFLSFENEIARERAVADHFVMIQNKQVS